MLPYALIKQVELKVIQNFYDYLLKAIHISLIFFFHFRPW